jgi:serine/threonine-protein kinase
MSWAPGDRVDRYEIVRAIASGGMGSVWLARAETGSLVALKTIRPELAADDGARRMFLDEARLIRRVEHAHVARVLGEGELATGAYLVLEWIDGASVEQLCERRAPLEPLPLAELLRIAADACAGLHAAHELRDEAGELVHLVHRDISPQNILVTRAGCAKVIDFGIAKARGRLAQTTETGVVRGKRAYMPPEQAFGEPVDRRADVWAMGAVVFRMLVGRPLFEETGSFRAYVKGTLAPALPPAIPEPVRAVVLRALALAPEDRFPTAEAMRLALEAALATLDLRADHETVATRFAGALAAVTDDSARGQATTAPLKMNPESGPALGGPTERDPEVKREAPVAPSPKSRRWWLAAAVPAVLVGAVLLRASVRDRDAPPDSGSLMAAVPVDATPPAADAPPPADADHPADAAPADAATTGALAARPRVRPPAPPPTAPVFHEDDPVTWTHNGHAVDANVMWRDRKGLLIRPVGDNPTYADPVDLAPRTRLPALPIGQAVKYHGTNCTVAGKLGTEDYTIDCLGLQSPAPRSSLTVAN